MDTTTNLIALPRLPARLRDEYGEPTPTYRRCYNAALDGVLRTTLVRGRHYVRDEDLPEIAAVLGLVAA